MAAVPTDAQVLTNTQDKKALRKKVKALKEQRAATLRQLKNSYKSQLIAAESTEERRLLKEERKEELNSTKESFSKRIEDLLAILFGRDAKDEKESSFPPAEITVKDEGEYAEVESGSAAAQHILQEARKYLGSPYSYGADGPSRFDCSGLVHRVYEENGILLPRSSRDQAEQGTSISTEEAKLGDLIFFSHSGNSIDHVGIVVDNSQGRLLMIHSSSSQGVIETDVTNSSYWKPRLKKAIRIL